jgi:hypothetical protein
MTEKLRKFDVFWTFVANFSDKVRTVVAKSITEAIEKSTPYDPRMKSDGGSTMKFIVWEHGIGLVHEGPITEVKE